MTPKEAEKIINQYGGALAAGTDGIARKISLLPCSKGRIRYAFYVLIGKVVLNNTLDQKTGDALVSSYGSMNQFIEDNEAEFINKIHNIVKAKKSYDGIDEGAKKKYKDFIVNMIDMRAIGEINEFIAECQKEHDEK